MSKNIYIGNIPFDYSEDQLHQLFQTEGKIVRTHLITDHETGHSKGFGFVEMENEDEGANAITKLNNFEIDGRHLIVNEARPRASRPVEAGDQKRKKSFRRW